MFKRLLLPLSSPRSLLAPAALAAGGNYVFDGGTQAEQAQVTAALNASCFPWGVVPGPVVIHIGSGVASACVAGQIWLDASLLDSGRFSWGVVQHEYAHQVDFAPSRPTRCAPSCTRSSAAAPGAGRRRTRAISTASASRISLAWAYWRSSDNVMKPASARTRAAVSPGRLPRGARRGPARRRAPTQPCTGDRRFREGATAASPKRVRPIYADLADRA